MNIFYYHWKVFWSRILAIIVKKFPIVYNGNFIYFSSCRSSIKILQCLLPPNHASLTISVEPNSYLTKFYPHQATWLSDQLENTNTYTMLEELMSYFYLFVYCNCLNVTNSFLLSEPKSLHLCAEISLSDLHWCVGWKKSSNFS